MITKLAFLFLLGTTMGSHLFMDKLKTAQYEIALTKSSKHSGCPTGAELAPLICKFMQPYLDMYYKPQLIAPSTYIPPLVVEKCETPELKMDLELPKYIVGKKPLMVPQPPELPPLTIPKFPVPVIVEDHPATISDHDESSNIEEMPVLHIPAAPQLPDFQMPVIPEVVKQPEPYIFEEALPEIDHNNTDEKPMIPEAPELPAFIMPEFPVRVEIPSSPVLPATNVPSPPKIDEKPDEEPSLSEVVAAPEVDHNKYEPISIPQPPELPAFVMPELPVIASYFENKPILISGHLTTLAHIPTPPELPPAVLPEFPVHVKIPSGLVLPSIDFASPSIEEQHAKDQNLVDDQRTTIPQAPKLPEFVMTELPTISDEMLPSVHVSPAADIPSPPMLVEQPTPFAISELPARIEIPSAPAPAKDLPSPPKIDEKPAEEPSLSEVVATPEIDYSKYEPILVPQPPELPAFVMPELPVIASYFEDKPILISGHLTTLAHIPTPTELPPAVLPEFPVHVEIPSGLVLPSIDFASPSIEEQHAKDQNLVDDQHTTIPQAPKLPEFVMPELPTISDEMLPSVHVLPAVDIPSQAMLVKQPTPFAISELPARIEIPSAPAPAKDLQSPPMIIEQPAEEPYHPEVMAAPEIDYNIIKSIPISIPASPKLPAFVMPEIPVRVVEEPSKVTVGHDLTSAPELSEFVMPALPSTFIGRPCESSGKLEADFAVMPNSFERYFGEKVKESHNIIIPAAMNHNLYPSPCVYNLVMQHVIPNIASDHLKSLEKVKVLPPSYIQCS